MKIVKMASVFWYYVGGKVVLHFVNHATGADKYGTYKTQAAAKAAETKFYNRVARVYGEGGAIQ